MTFHIWCGIFLKLIWEKELYSRQIQIMAIDSSYTTFHCIFYILGAMTTEVTTFCGSNARNACIMVQLMEFIAIQQIT